jgi:tRNA nucleotidyltransferase (CCA-adding enzyme)
MLPPTRTLAWLLWLSPVNTATIKILARRLRFPAALIKLLLAASNLRAELPALKNAKPSGWVKRLDGLPEFAVYSVLLSVDGKAKQALQDYLEKWQHVRANATGYDLKQLGLPPGPRYQNILRELRNAWLDGKIKTAQEETELLQQLVQ